MIIYKVISRSLIAALCLVGTMQPALAGESPLDDLVVVPEGGERALGTDDFGPHTPEGNAYNEVWTYTFLLNDGMQATFNLSYARLGSLMAPVSGAEFSISGFDGQTFRAPKQYDAEDLTYVPETGRLQVHPKIYVEGTLPGRHRIRFEAWKDGLDYEVDLTLTEVARGLTWGDGVFELGSERLGMFIHIPYARVAGTVTIEGATKRVSGTAYMDHTFQTEFAPKLVRSSYRYIQHSGDMEVGYFIAPHDRYQNRIIGLGAVKERGRFRLRKPESVQVVSSQRTLRTDVPKQLLMRYEGGGQTILNRDRDSQSFAALGDLGSIQRAVVKRYIGGEVAVFRGRGITNQRHRFAYDFLVVK